MRYLFLSLFTLALTGCNTEGFESDERQIIAKDLIRKQILQNHSFDVVAFKQDTVDWQDIAIKHPVSYTLDFVYNDHKTNGHATEYIKRKKALTLNAHIISLHE